MEQRIYGRELTDAVLGERYLPPVETFPSVENFDYEAKYQAGGAKEICPAELTEEQAKAVGRLFPDGYDHGRKRAALVSGGQLPAGNDPYQLRAQGGRRRGHQL